ncbi:Protein-glutamate methylesterase/protein-glutamine glutaminase [Paenibacillus solanacearum]|uniref:Protein-glutamate methylesterase/protein-glutamine glutaminase n=1 Tax=Paenibacillus solanacearum TaxID=2048548 RepID=A0A916K9A4_9BACL|nr:response regulator [Paenibacillus solanacearum]CAG7651824.1 Protein-glutamate methylesterase/protein-glutamine glutaminase [Paenibacillus solanacearum]
MIRAMIVDDEYFVRKGLITTLPWESFGIRIVAEANNGKKALELLADQPVDLIFTDLTMPVMNGFDLMRSVRAQYPWIDIVILTCHQDFNYIQDTLRLGALDYIVKTELEAGNLEESLRRITDQLRGAADGRREAPEPVARWLDSDEAMLQSHMDEWLKLYWVVKDDEFDRLCACLETIRPPMPKLHKVMHYLIMEMNRLIGLGELHEWLNRSEHVCTWEDWRRFIVHFRGAISHKLRCSSYPEYVLLLILDAMEYMKTNVDSKVTQSAMAAKARMSRSYFSKSFKDIVGKSFPEYLKELRIRRAKLLLMQTNRQVADIAEECGFQDYRYFSRQFREETGFLPSEFRMSVGDSAVLPGGRPESEL